MYIILSYGLCGSHLSCHWHEPRRAPAMVLYSFVLHPHSICHLTVNCLIGTLLYHCKLRNEIPPSMCVIASGSLNDAQHALYVVAHCVAE